MIYALITWQKAQDSHIKDDKTTYYSSLKPDQLEDLIEEEDFVHEKIGMKTISDQTLQILVDNKEITNKKVEGLHSYNILDNPIYQTQFGYIPVWQRAAYDVTQSIKVRAALLLPFIPKTVL